MNRYLDYVGPFIWLGLGIAFAVKGNAWLALAVGVLAGVRLVRVSRLLGQQSRIRKTPQTPTS